MLALDYLQENLLLDSVICIFPDGGWEFLGYLQQCSGWNEMLCVARVMDAQNLLLTVLGRPELLPVAVALETRNGEEPGSVDTCGEIMEKLWQQWSVFDVLSAHMEKETDCLTNAKSTRGICAFLGKVVLCCDCNKDSAFNFSSSRVPKGR